MRMPSVLVLKHDIGGELLISSPVIRLAGEYIFEERVDKIGEFLKKGWLVEAAELIGQILGFVRISYYRSVRKRCFFGAFGWRAIRGH
jgi:hypothetical protein